MLKFSRRKKRFISLELAILRVAFEASFGALTQFWRLVSFVEAMSHPVA